MLNLEKKLKTNMVGDASRGIFQPSLDGKLRLTRVLFIRCIASFFKLFPPKKEKKNITPTVRHYLGDPTYNSLFVGNRNVVSPMSQKPILKEATKLQKVVLNFMAFKMQTEKKSHTGKILFKMHTLSCCFFVL